MPVAVPRFGAEECPLLPPVRVEDLEGLVIRPATVRDVHGMSALINQYAAANVMLARGPQYLYQHIQDYMVAVTPAADGKTPGGGGLPRAACAVGRSGRDPFAGGARRLSGPRPGPPDGGCPGGTLPRPGPAARVCLYPGGDIFARCGFSEYQRDKLPPVVWVECSKCPKFYCCDETAMILEL